MPYIQGENREQMTLTPMCLDDYIEDDNICRVISAYVYSLDMVALGFKYAEPKNTGRPPHNPASLLMLYLYGYLNRIRSSRRLETETKRNVEVMWLMEKVMPDDKTICNFRKDNAIALKRVFREFSLWCNRQGLYDKELIAVDGTKIRANSSRKNIFTKRSTEKELLSIDKKISEYINELEAADAAEENEVKLSPDTIKEILEHLNKKKENLDNRLKQIEANGGKEISTVDPDAHFMHQGGDGRNLDACYNVQTVVDSKNKLIIEFDVSTCPDDKGALPQMTQAAKEIMGVSEINVVADKGYYDGSDIAECEKKGTACYIPAVENYIHAPDRKFNRSNFRYDKENDCYICPENKYLPFRYFEKGNRNTDPKRYRRVYHNSEACRDCPSRAKCTPRKTGGRTVKRLPDQYALDIVSERMATANGREIMKRRSNIVEHPFGTTKYIWGYRQFLCRTQEKVTGEQSLVFLAYNLRRIFNIFKGNGKSMLQVIK